MSTGVFITPLGSKCRLPEKEAYFKSTIPAGIRYGANFKYRKGIFRRGKIRVDRVGVRMPQSGGEWTTMLNCPVSLWNGDNLYIEYTVHYEGKCK